MSEEKEFVVHTSRIKRLVRRYQTGSSAVRERVTMDGQCRVTVYGCLRILVYSPTEIRLMLAKEELSVLGRELYCSSFSAGAVTVEGLIGGVLYRRMRRELLGEGRGVQ